MGTMAVATEMVAAVMGMMVVAAMGMRVAAVMVAASEIAGMSVWPALMVAPMVVLVSAVVLAVQVVQTGQLLTRPVPSL